MVAQDKWFSEPGLVSEFQDSWGVTQKTLEKPKPQTKPNQKTKGMVAQESVLPVLKGVWQEYKIILGYKV